jgi:hypothetical protein
MLIIVDLPKPSGSYFFIDMVLFVDYSFASQASGPILGGRIQILIFAKGVFSLFDGQSGKGGQTSWVSLAGVLYVQRSHKLRRHGD